MALELRIIFTFLNIVKAKENLKDSNKKRMERRTERRKEERKGVRKEGRKKLKKKKCDRDITWPSKP